MKKKILAGLLTVSACFTLGSTSFANSVSTTTLNNSELRSPITTLDQYSAVIKLVPGQTVWLTGYDFWYESSDGCVEVYPAEGRFVALKPGVSVVIADFGNGNTMAYTIVVRDA
jgi:hypothetical protein